MPEKIENIDIKLSKDITANLNTISTEGVKFLVKYYYTLQDHRKILGNQIKSMDEDIKHTGLLQHFYNIQQYSEDEVKRCLKIWVERTYLGQWCMSHTGIGPVITAGLMSSIDINIGTTAAKVTRYCGLDPGSRRVKGEKINYNPDMKRLAWLIGRSFVFNSNREGCDYGKLYKERLKKETSNNDGFMYREQALEQYKKIKDSRDKKKKKVEEVEDELMGEEMDEKDILAVLKSGKLTKGWLISRSARWAVKIFLSHYQYVATVIEKGSAPIRPYAFQILGHAEENYIPPFNWPMEFDEKKRKKKLPTLKVEGKKITTEEFENDKN